MFLQSLGDRNLGIRFAKKSQEYKYVVQYLQEMKYCVDTFPFLCTVYKGLGVFLMFAVNHLANFIHCFKNTSINFRSTRKASQSNNGIV